MKKIYTTIVLEEKVETFFEKTHGIEKRHTTFWILEVLIYRMFLTNRKTSEVVFYMQFVQHSVKIKHDSTNDTPNFFV
jgi:hypothetical protein